jgi:hypothetical protein
MIVLGDTSAFADLGAGAILFIFGAHFLGFFIRGAFGFGSNMPIVLLTTWVLEPHHAILLVALTSGIAQFHLLPQGVRSADWAIVRPLSLGMLVGVMLGVWVFASLASDWLVVVLALLVAIIVLMDRFRVLDHVGRRIDLRSTRLAAGLAAVSGTVGTVSGGGGLYFLIVYLKLVCRDPLSLRATNVVLSGVFMLVRLALLALTGLFTAEFVFEAATLVPAVFLGTWAGTRLFHATPPARFYDLLQYLLLAAALALLAKGIMPFV